MKRRRPQRLRWLAIVALSTGASVAGCSGRVEPRPAATSKIRIVEHGKKGPGAAQRTPPDLARAVESVLEQIGPSVVQLTADMPQKSAHEPLRSLEGDPFVVMRAGPLGSGVIVGHNLVLTAGHVVEHAGELRARLQDGRELPATVIARDGTHDLALLQVRGDLGPLRALPVGSGAPRAGEMVMAIGNLYGLGPTVTVGVVSSTPGEEKSPSETLETDAAINLTNTGGPIVNLRGELVGIANAKLTEQRGMRGLSYATSTEVIGPLLTGLKVGDEPLREQASAMKASALRGLATDDIDPELRKRFAISDNLSHGAVVTSVEPKSPAAAVGIEPGDVVVEVDFVPVLSSGMFVQAAAVDGPLLLLVVRGNAAAYVLVHP